MKKMFLAFFAFFFVSGPVFAGSAIEDLLRVADKYDAPSAPAVNMQPSEKDKGSVRETAEWTIMVFMNGKNSLSEYIKADFNEMEMAGSNSKVNIVAELGCNFGPDSYDGSYYSVNRYLVKHDTDMNAIASPVLQKLPGTDMGDWKELAAFGKWAKANFPAKRYFLIVENHGSGWDKKIPAGINRGISYDDETDNYINTPQLAQAIREMGGVNVYGSDACLMQMAEVAYELKDMTEYVVGSEETEPGEGGDYAGFLVPFVNAADSINSLSAAKLFMDSYGDFYDKTGEGYTQSIISSKAMPAFPAAVKKFTSAIMKAGDSKTARSAMSKIIYFENPASKDFAQLADYMAQNSQNAEVKEAAQNLSAYIKDNVIAGRRAGNSRYGGPDYAANANGIAVYFSSSQPYPHYGDLSWNKASGWLDFISWLGSK